MSISSPSSALPFEATLESGLCDAVKEVFKLGNLEDLTVKRIRKVVEEKLGLDNDFFKSDKHWKDKSKHIIQAEVDAHSDIHPSNPPLSQTPGVTKEGTISYTERDIRKLKSKPQGKKRTSGDNAESQARKKRKTTSNDGSLCRAPDDQPEGESELESQPKRPIKTEEGNSEEKALIEAEANGTHREVDGSESEMSVVLDEDPKLKKKRQKSEAKPKTKKPEATKARKSTDGFEDPGLEEIKRLQGWLIKCGIRKMWHKELAPYDNPKGKIKHLKQMLTDVGMTGRYSKEKAEQIREECELKADLEAVQEGDKAWGKSSGEESEEAVDSKPRRRLARGLQGLDFLNDDDGEETD